MTGLRLFFERSEKRNKEGIKMTNNGMLLPVIAYSQSSYEGHEAGKAFDHNRGTSWKAGPYYQWIMADLQRNCSVS